MSHGRNFPRRIFRRIEFSPYGVFAVRNFRRMEFSPYGILAVRISRRNASTVGFHDVYKLHENIFFIDPVIG